jgi:hypothetical protein
VICSVLLSTIPVLSILGKGCNASKPQREDLILLRQCGYVTHLVEVLDYKPEHEKWQGDFNIYRIVEVVWGIDWNNPPDSARADEVFGYPVKLQGGDVMFLALSYSINSKFRGGFFCPTRE